MLPFGATALHWPNIYGINFIVNRTHPVQASGKLVLQKTILIWNFSQGGFPYCVFTEAKSEIDCGCDEWESDEGVLDFPGDGFFPETNEVRAKAPEAIRIHSCQKIQLRIDLRPLPETLKKLRQAALQALTAVQMSSKWRHEKSHNKKSTNDKSPKNWKTWFSGTLTHLDTWK